MHTNSITPNYLTRDLSHSYPPIESHYNHLIHEVSTYANKVGKVFMTNVWLVVFTVCP